MEEIWKDIEGYEGLYQVSNTGKIKSFPRNTTKGGILKPSKDKDGYLYVLLYKNGKRVHCKIHRIVAQAFIPNIQDKYTVNHKDGNKLNNSVNNLEWNTIKENNIHAFKTGLKHMPKGKESKLAKAIIQYSKEMKKVAEYDCIKDVEKNTKYKSSYISQSCKGKYPNAYGYIWKYKE